MPQCKASFPNRFFYTLPSLGYRWDISSEHLEITSDRKATRRTCYGQLQSNECSRRTHFSVTLEVRWLLSIPVTVKFLGTHDVPIQTAQLKASMSQDQLESWRDLSFAKTSAHPVVHIRKRESRVVVQNSEEIAVGLPPVSFRVAQPGTKQQQRMNRPRRRGVFSWPFYLYLRTCAPFERWHIGPVWRIFLGNLFRPVNSPLGTRSAWSGTLFKFRWRCRVVSP